MLTNFALYIESEQWCSLQNHGLGLEAFRAEKVLILVLRLKFVSFFVDKTVLRLFVNYSC